MRTLWLLELINHDDSECHLDVVTTPHINVASFPNLPDHTNRCTILLRTPYMAPTPASLELSGP